MFIKDAVSFKSNGNGSVEFSIAREDGEWMSREIKQKAKDVICYNAFKKGGWIESKDVDLVKKRSRDTVTYFKCQSGNTDKIDEWLAKIGPDRGRPMSLVLYCSRFPTTKIVNTHSC